MQQLQIVHHQGNRRRREGKYNVDEKLGDII